MPLKFNDQIGAFETVQAYTPDPTQLTHLQNELTRLQTREEEIQQQIAATEGEQLATQAQLGALKGDNSLEGIDQRVTSILAAEKKLELLADRNRALGTLLEACKDQMKPLPAQILGYETAIQKEANSQAIEAHLPAFLEAQERYLELREQLWQLLQTQHNFNTSSLNPTDKVEVDGRVLKFRVVK